MKFKFAFLFSLLIFTAPSAFAGKTPPQLTVEYSADMEMTSDGKPQMTGKVFQSGKKQRMEMGGNASITRLDKKVMWQLMPKQKSFMEMPLQAENLPPTEKSDAELTEMGSETVNGVSATKYKVVSKEDGKKTESFIWFTKEGIMVKTEGHREGKTAGMVLKNLKVGKQDASLFEIPDGYKAMGNPMDMFAAMQKKQKQEQKDAGIETYPDAKLEKFTELAEYSAITNDDARVYVTKEKAVVRPEARNEGWERVYAVIQRDKGTTTEIKYIPDMCAYTESAAADPARWRKEYADLSRYSIMFLKAMKKSGKDGSTTEGSVEMTDAAGAKLKGQMTISGDNVILNLFATIDGKIDTLIERKFRSAKAGKPDASHLDPTKGFKKLSAKEFEKLMGEMEERGSRSFTADDGSTQIPGNYCPKGKRPKEAGLNDDEERDNGKSGGKKTKKDGNKEEQSGESPDAMKALKKLGGKFGF